MLLAAGWRALITLLMIPAVAEGGSEYFTLGMVRGLLAERVGLPITNLDALFPAITWEPMVSR